MTADMPGTDPENGHQPFSRKYVNGLGFHGFHRIHYLDWHPKSDPTSTVVCVHGLTRNARDFDYLAGHISDSFRTVCPDVAGRGDSDDLPTAESYNYLQYNADMNALLARLHVDQVDWIGTSMGGIIGMIRAAQPNSPINSLVLNDIGAEIPKTAIRAIGDYIGQQPGFASLDEAEQFLRTIYHEFSPMSDEDWRSITHHSFKISADGQYEMKADRKIGDAYRAAMTNHAVDMWDTWEAVSCPVLILRGKNSSFLDETTARRMLRGRDNVSLVEFENTGHTPTLRNDEQADIVKNWLISQHA